MDDIKLEPKNAYIPFDGLRNNHVVVTKLLASEQKWGGSCALDSFTVCQVVAADPAVSFKHGDIVFVDGLVSRPYPTDDGEPQLYLLKAAKIVAEFQVE